MVSKVRTKKVHLSNFWPTARPNSATSPDEGRPWFPLRGQLMLMAGHAEFGTPSVVIVFCWGFL